MSEFDTDRVENTAEDAETRQTTRRQFLTTGAKLAAGGTFAFAFAGVPRLSVAQTAPADECQRAAAERFRAAIAACGSNGQCRRDALAQYNADLRACRAGGGGGGQPVGDVDVLNYALTLEHLEANFYIEAVNTFSESEIESYIAAQGFGPAVADTAWQRIIDVRDHEVIHVQTLQQVITNLGGTPVPPCVYNFDGALASVQSFLATSMTLENTGVMAYDGAIDLIESRQIQTAGATIATVEARHASYFNLLNGSNPFPAAFDTPVEPPQIIEAVLATGLIVSCPVPPPIPDQPRGCPP